MSPREADELRGRPDLADTGETEWSNPITALIVEKYGPPDRAEDMRLVWDHRGPWLKIAVWEDPGSREDDRTQPHIEETIPYVVPESKRDDVAAFSGSLRVSDDGTELSASSTAEERNYLMLNLADEVVKGFLTPEEARVSYFDTLRLEESGKSPSSMRRLLFQ
jgi:hypothetical protein